MIWKKKNALSVAVKTVKKELSEQNKESATKMKELEKNLDNLTQFKNKRLAEERETKKKQKKEAKRTKKEESLKALKNDLPTYLYKPIPPS